MKRYLPVLCGLAVSTAVSAQTPSPGVDQRLQERFRQADVNADGSLDPAEAATAKFAFSKSFENVDTDRNGLVTLFELGDALQTRMQSWFTDLDAADRDKDGVLSEAEAEAAPSVGKVFKQADTNFDNRVSRQEYETFMQRDLYGNVDLPYVVPNLFEKRF